MNICSKCNKRNAIIFQHHSGEKLCKNCFIDDVIIRVKTQIDRYNMISPSDVIAVGVSGGKDSFVLLNILAEITSSNRIISITIDEGIHGYNRNEIYKSIKAFCSDIGVEHIYVAIRDILGYGVDDFMKHYLSLAKDKNSISLSACTYCGIARRRVLNMYAREIGATKVATAHNLDDEIQTYIINILRGDIMRLIQLHPLSETHSRKLIKRIKPMRNIYEYESAFYAYLLGYSFQEYECPYIELRPTLRIKIRSLLNEIEKLSPGTQLRLIEFIDTIVGSFINTRHISLPLCRLCGEPTSPNRSICKFCELIELVSKK